ncbi:hypothetical protein QTP70_020023 [Hemibagrus guttatus]|uniref:Gypsy retrotransposon integrase-like protein 1 n=1 Tax=Hemibagrus guttatus TaxID=175788 RepID=A0AAE0UXH7_9TELE|nr:hypothetical protein QTP70_020023 [Hemibagrus guttatus]
MCTFSKKLSPVEQNYDIGHRELLAIKLALEEWWHWLEGVNHLFEVIMNHKNLQYLREAKRLNPRQARPFPRPSAREPEPILPPNLFVCPKTWSLDDDIHVATEEEPALPGGPDGKEYVPTSLRLSLLDSVHASPGSGHPGRQRTLSLLKERYWWPNIAQDVTRFIRGCSVCAMISTSRRLPESKLVTLPILHCPWSHLGIDFATELPVSNGFSTILVRVDHFSKACKLILLKGLPTALEMAEALISNDILTFQRTLCLIEGLNSFPECGEGSSSCQGCRCVFPLGITHRRMARLNVRSKRSGATSGPTAPTISTTGANTSPGPSIRRTLYARNQPN